MARSRVAGGLKFRPPAFPRLLCSLEANNLPQPLTSDIAKNLRLADIPGYLVLAGGAPIRVDGAVVGAVGVGGAPSGLTDEKCGTDAVATVLGR